MNLGIYEPKILQVSFRFDVKPDDNQDECEESAEQRDSRFLPNGLVYYPEGIFRSLREGIREKKNFLIERVYDSFFIGGRKYSSVCIRTEQHPEELAQNIVKRLERSRFVSNVGDVLSFLKVREDYIKKAIEDLLGNPELYYTSAEKKMIKTGFFGD